MKKKIFLVSALIAMAMGVMVVSCKDKNEAEDKSEDINGCKCTFYYDGEKGGSEKFDIDEMEDYWEASTCAKLEKAIMKELTYGDPEYEDYFSIKCKAY